MPASGSRRQKQWGSANFYPRFPHLNPVVPGVRHNDVPHLVHCHAVRSSKFSVLNIDREWMNRWSQLWDWKQIRIQDMHLIKHLYQYSIICAEGYEPEKKIQKPTVANSRIIWLLPQKDDCCYPLCSRHLLHINQVILVPISKKKTKRNFRI